MGLISWLFGKSKGENTPDHRIDPNNTTAKGSKESSRKEFSVSYKRKSIDYNEIKTSILIDYINMQKTDLRFPQYLTYLCEGMEKKLLNKAFKDGYIRFASPQEALKKLLVPDLKNILKENDLPVSGKKSVLISRILDSLPEEKYRNIVPSIYVLTEAGENLVSKNYIFIQHRYGVDTQFCQRIFEITDRLGCGTTKDDYIKVFSEIYKADIRKAKRSKNWGDLSTAYNYFSLLLGDVNCPGFDLKRSLQYCLYSICIDLSGMTNQNFVQKNDIIMISPAMINQINDLEMNIPEKTIRTEIDSAISKMLDILPFSYFSQNSMHIILGDLLTGELESTDIYKIEKYKNLWETPDPNSSKYEYINWDDFS